MESILIRIAISPFLILALTVHEFAHAWVANRLGDQTPKYYGRLTLNPLSHMDLLGSLMVIMLGFGWAKPVPVNPNSFKNPPLHMGLVALAGPISNIILALLGVITSNFINPYGLDMFVWINIYLATFNLLPLPPLDGWRVLQGLNPRFYGDYELEQKLSYVLLGLIFLSILTPIDIIRWFLYPISSFLYNLFHTLV